MLRRARNTRGASWNRTNCRTAVAGLGAAVGWEDTSVYVRTACTESSVTKTAGVFAASEGGGAARSVAVESGEMKHRYARSVRSRSHVFVRSGVVTVVSFCFA